ncbi:hypothetical protein [Aulosira sp. FACHB-615]|uniref:hypothetical protein n=1 Tax=Aulosira sp. FACHB-615 TaxID=2692777 RepID=UPI0016887A44|nr:hypothetical protein [Aulosira sp. FACHB-615]MBD2492603.1 hypothetical protein [Aulosira sp. FACHB-615]
MKEIPILFSTPMVLAILDKRKTQTRRVIKPQPEMCGDHFREPLKQRWSAGDRLWVREAWDSVPDYDGGYYIYKADYSKEDQLKVKWKPSIHMPKAACRIWLEVVGVRVERLQDIDEEGAIAEGCTGRDESIIRGSRGDTIYCSIKPYYQYKNLWESINGYGSWDLNPYVWVIEFKKL